MKVSISQLFLVLALLAGCATQPLPKAEISQIKTIAIINDFPDSPTYQEQSTDAFENNTQVIESLNLKNLLSEQVKSYLNAKGYKTVMAEDKDILATSNVDFAVAIVPKDALAKPYTNGYGFFQTSILGKTSQASSYVALNLVPYAKQDQALKEKLVNLAGYSKNDMQNLGLGSLGVGYYQENFDALNVDILPASWDALSAQQKNELVANLKNNITKTLALLLPKLGL